MVIDWCACYSEDMIWRGNERKKKKYVFWATIVLLFLGGGCCKKYLGFHRRRLIDIALSYLVGGRDKMLDNI